MVKFSKQFEGQLVPEWKEAFVDYWQLKKDVKKFHLLNNKDNNNHNNPTKHHHHHHHHGSLSNNFLSSLRDFSLFGHPHRSEHGAIQVHRKLASSASQDDKYETELIEQFDNTDAAKEFFSCLDLQLNKVNQFYRNKEKEFLDRGDCLKKQMEILLELKTALKQQRGKGASAQDSEDGSISCTISSDEDSVRDRTEQEQTQDINTDELEKSEVLESGGSTELGKSMSVKREDSTLRTLSGRNFNCQGKNLRINIPLTTPTRTLSAISYLVWDDLVNQSSRKCNPEGRKLHINKTKLHHVF